MSAVVGVNATLVATGGLASQLAKGTYDARVKCIIDTYEASGLATSSTITMGGTLPAGARIVGVTLAYDALSTVTLSVGDSASAGRYISALATANAAGVSSAILVDGLDYVVGTTSGDNQIIISTTGVSSATGTIKVATFYTQD